MRRILFLPLFSLLFAMTLPAAAEEILLKDGTKIVGHMSALQADKIEVETSYGKMQLKRSDILSINFPENGSPSAGGSDSTAVKTDAPKMDETLNGIQYINRTAKFTLALPPDWTIAADLHRAPDTVAGPSALATKCATLSSPRRNTQDPLTATRI
jgi:hypothetical protein